MRRPAKSRLHDISRLEGWTNDSICRSLDVDCIEVGGLLKYSEATGV